MAGELADSSMKIGKKVAEAYVDVDNVISFDLGDGLSRDSVDLTNSSSGGFRTQIPGGIVKIDDVTLVIAATDLTIFTDDFTAGTVSDWEVTFPDAEKWQFKGFVSAVSPVSVDLTSPSGFKATVKISTSGAMVIA